MESIWNKCKLDWFCSHEISNNLYPNLYKIIWKYRTLKNQPTMICTFLSLCFFLPVSLLLSLCIFQIFLKYILIKSFLKTHRSFLTVHIVHIGFCPFVKKSINFWITMAMFIHYRKYAERERNKPCIISPPRVRFIFFTFCL